MGFVGLAVLLGSWFAIHVMLAFWLESNSYPNLFAGFMGEYGVHLSIIALCSLLVARLLLGKRLSLFDLLFFVPSLSGLYLYLSFQGYI